jgi:hypothetical protein
MRRMKMGQKSYLTYRQKESLLNWLAATGENYDKYIEWCDKNSVPKEQRFTPKYLHTWVQRRRPKFQNARADHQEELRRLSMYDKDKRIADHENSINIINSHLMAQNSGYSSHVCTKCGFTHEVEGPEVVIKLLEQKRKLSQAVAIERGEWGKADAEPKRTESSRDLLRAAALQALANPTGKVTVISPRTVGESEG